MRKHDEGFTLLFVLLVLIVLGILTSFMLGFSLQHVQVQRSYTGRMQNQYAAAGELEAQVLQLETLLGEELVTDAILTLENPIPSEEGTVALTAVVTPIQIQCVLPENWATAGEKPDGILILTAISGTVQVQKTYAITGATITGKAEGTYELTAIDSMACTAYQVSTMTGGGD